MDIDNDVAIMQWWHPGTSKEANLKAGRKKAILDLFGEWRPSVVSELEPLPSSVLRSSKILIWGFALGSDRFLPFATLDRIMDLDIVDLTWVQTLQHQKRCHVPCPSNHANGGLNMSALGHAMLQSSCHAFFHVRGSSLSI